VLAKKLASVRTLGPHPKDGGPLMVKRGRFGPYVQHGSTVANLPRGVEMEALTPEAAVALLAERGKVLKPKGANGGRKAPTRKAAAKAPAARKAAVSASPAPRAAAKKKPPAKKKAAAEQAPARKRKTA
jgi:DNA topoisomerase-1